LFVLINIIDVDGNTALHKACFNEKREVINYLIENYPILKDIPNNKGTIPNI
jgi:ankyrin repeat protein